MNKTVSFIISLIKSALDGSVAEVPEGIDWESVFYLGKAYQLVPLMYCGAANSRIDIPGAISQEYESIALNCLMYDQRQGYIISELLKLFDSEGIEHMPIKGILLKSLYPSSELRPMGDGDILINLEQYEKVSSVMKENGYQFRCESAHEYIYNKKGVCIELHKHLIPPYNKDYHSYYGNGWRLAEKESGYRYKLSDDDHYIYLFTHLAKHYRDGGVGPIHLVDMWVYSREKQLDFEYIESELAKLQLQDFHRNILSTVKAWFCGGENTVITDFITERFFNYGNFGTIETHAVASAAKMTKSTSVKGIAYKKGLKRLFPSVEKMKYKYPVLEKHAFLLPFCWVHRIFAKRSKLKDRLHEVKITTEEKVAAYKDELAMVGLDFNFKE